VVTLNARPAGTRVSFTAWAGGKVTAGSTSKINWIKMLLNWQDAAGVTVGTFITIGSTTDAAEILAGRIFSAKSLLMPSGATKALVRLIFNVTWTSDSAAGKNSDVRQFVDAVAVTIP
jgi:hypothetical protein